MRASNLPVRILFLGAAAGACMMAATEESMAQYGGRANRGEVFGIFRLMGGDRTTSYGDEIILGDSFHFGFGVGYNVDEHINVNTDFLVGGADIDAIVFDEYLWGDTTIVGWDLNLDYNFLEGNFSPLVTGGIGFMNFDGDFGPGSATFPETDFSCNFGVGVRWDFNDRMLLKAVYRFNRVKLKDTDSALLLDGLHLAFGVRF